jgi:hypothetical protein
VLTTPAHGRTFFCDPFLAAVGGCVARLAFLEMPTVSDSSAYRPTRSASAIVVGFDAADNGSFGPESQDNRGSPPR